MRQIIKTAALAGAVTLVAFPALAHTGGGHTEGLMAGLAHPVTGADHLLAMLSVGMWSSIAAPKRTWIAPLAFVAAMLAGAGLAFAGIGLPAVESMIAASVLALGLMVVAGGRLPVTAGVALCGLFALFHGHAHASEATGSMLAYIAGFAVSTAMIHISGLGFGAALTRKPVVRFAIGSAVTTAGALLLAGL